MVMRMAGDERSLYRAPARTHHPRSSSPRTTAASSGTGTQTLSPVVPWAGMPRRARACTRDRKSVVEGKSVDLGGRRIIKKKKEECYARCVGTQNTTEA